jgi:hypothetical protein
MIKVIIEIAGQQINFAAESMRIENNEMFLGGIVNAKYSFTPPYNNRGFGR